MFFERYGGKPRPPGPEVDDPLSSYLGQVSEGCCLVQSFVGNHCCRTMVLLHVVSLGLLVWCSRWGHGLALMRVTLGCSGQRFVQLYCGRSRQVYSAVEANGCNCVAMGLDVVAGVSKQ